MQLKYIPRKENTDTIYYYLLQRQYTWHRLSNYIELIQKNIVKTKKTYSRKAEGTAVPWNFKAPHDGRVG
jgi:hypothetical protein